MKKANATLDKNITIEDIEQYLAFEAKYTQIKVSTNILELFGLLFPDHNPRGIGLNEFQYDYGARMNRANLGRYKTYFEPGDLDHFYEELETLGIIDRDEIRVLECSKHIEDQIALYPK